MPPLKLPAQEEALLEFARAAADHFAANPKHWTYTAGEVESGVLFAVRWGLDLAKAHAVLVFRIDEPVIYGDLDYDRAHRRAGQRA